MSGQEKEAIRRAESRRRTVVALAVEVCAICQGDVDPLVDRVEPEHLEPRTTDERARIYEIRDHIEMETGFDIGEGPLPACYQYAWDQDARVVEGQVFVYTPCGTHIVPDSGVLVRGDGGPEPEEGDGSPFRPASAAALQVGIAGIGAAWPARAGKEAPTVETPCGPVDPAAELERLQEEAVRAWPVDRLEELEEAHHG